MIPAKKLIRKKRKVNEIEELELGRCVLGHLDNLIPPPLKRASGSLEDIIASGGELEEDSASPRGGATEEEDCGEAWSVRIGVWEIQKKKVREKKKTMKEYMVSEQKKKPRRRRRRKEWFVGGCIRYEPASTIFSFSFYY